MADPREELAALRRLAELEAKAANSAPQQAEAGPQRQVGRAEDAIRSFATAGVPQGLASIAGSPGDLVKLGNWAGGKLPSVQIPGNNPQPQGQSWSAAGDPQRIAQQLGNMSNAQAMSEKDTRLPGSEEINNAISEPFGGYYEPKYTTGEYARTAGQFATNALFPGSAGQRIARVLTPSVSSETGGQIAKKVAPEWEPVFRAVGALGGGFLQGAGEGFLASRAAPKTAATAMQELGNLKNQTYKAAEQAGVVVRPGSFQNYAIQLGDDISQNNVVQSELHPKTFAALNVVQQEAGTGIPLTLERADKIRQAIYKAAKTADDDDARIIGHIIKSFDDYLENIPPSELLSGDVKTAIPILRQARDLARREFKAKEVQKLIDLAKASAKGPNRVSSMEQALSREFTNFEKRFIKDPNWAMTFTDAEREAIQRAAWGTPAQNFLSRVGKQAPSGTISQGVGAGIGYTLGNAVAGPPGGLVGAMAVPAVGGAARMGANSMASRNADLAAALMRAGPGATQVPATANTLPRNLLLDALLSQGAH